MESFKEHQGDKFFFIVFIQKYQGKEKKPQITTLQHISKPSLRIYSNHKEIPKVLGEIGIVILSIFQGIVIDQDTCQKQIGRNFLCYVWYRVQK